MLLKKQAAATEDCDEAKRCKLCIENMQSAAKPLFVLEREMLGEATVCLKPVPFAGDHRDQF